MAMTTTTNPLLAAVGSSLQALAALAIECEQEAARAMLTGDPNEIGKARARVRGVQRMAATMLEPIERARASLTSADAEGAHEHD